MTQQTGSYAPDDARLVSGISMPLTRIRASAGVEIEPIPGLSTDSSEWSIWCKERDIDPLHSGRRGWCHALSTSLQGATGLVYRDGELVDLWTDDLPQPKCPRCSGSVNADEDGVLRCDELTLQDVSDSPGAEWWDGCGWRAESDDDDPASVTISCPEGMARVLTDIVLERSRQDTKFGPIRDMDLGEWVCVLVEEIGEVTEEHAEMLLAVLVAALMSAGGRVAQAVHETIGERTGALRHGREAIRKECIQVAAVAVNITQHMDRNNT